MKIGKPSPAEDAERLAAVRAAVGPDFDIMVDANQSLTAAEAIRRARLLEPHDPCWFEEPLPADDIAGHAAAGRATTMPVAVGESMYSIGQFAEYLRRRRRRHRPGRRRAHRRHHALAQGRPPGRGAQRAGLPALPHGAARQPVRRGAEQPLPRAHPAAAGDHPRRDRRSATGRRSPPEPASASTGTATRSTTGGWHEHDGPARQATGHAASRGRGGHRICQGLAPAVVGQPACRSGGAHRRAGRAVQRRCGPAFLDVRPDPGPDAGRHQRLRRRGPGPALRALARAHEHGGRADGRHLDLRRRAWSTTGSTSPARRRTGRWPARRCRSPARSPALVITRTGVNSFVVTLALDFALLGLVAILYTGSTGGVAFAASRPGWPHCATTRSPTTASAPVCGPPVPLIVPVAVVALVAVGVLFRCQPARPRDPDDRLEHARRPSCPAYPRPPDHRRAQRCRGCSPRSPGFLLAINNGAFSANIGESFLLPSFLAPVLGGTLLAGGAVSVLGTVLGATLTSVIQKGLNLCSSGPTSSRSTSVSFSCSRCPSTGSDTCWPSAGA